MIRIIRLILIISATGVSAQQNLFNVPSSDITEHNKFFFQQQFNFSHRQVQLNSTLCYGLGKEAEIGINMFGLNMKSTGSLFNTNGNIAEPPVYPFFMLNAQKAFTFNKLFKLSIGTQLGFSKNWHFGSYTYGNLITALHRTHTKIITGIYEGSNSFLGTDERNEFFARNEFGFQVGIEQEIIDGLTIIAENISGRHELGESTLGACYYVFDHWALSVGHQFANPKSKTLRALVLEITYTPSAHIHRRLFRHGHHQPNS